MAYDMQQLLFLCFLITLPWFCSSLCDRDLTIKSCATGDDVVRATIAKIRAARLLDNVTGCSGGPGGGRNNCYQFLERIAYAESGNNCTKNGGMWGVSQNCFSKVTGGFFHVISNSSFVRGLSKPIINIPAWRSVQRGELKKPLYSAIAAAIFLIHRNLFAEVNTPGGQRRTWDNYIRDCGTQNSTQFLQAVSRAIQGE